MKKFLIAAIALCSVNAMAFSSPTGVVTKVQKNYSNKVVTDVMINFASYVGGSTTGWVTVSSGYASGACGSVSGTTFGTDLADLVKTAETALSTGAKFFVIDNSRAACTTNSGYVFSGDAVSFGLTK